jgi:hypothetical protein
MDKVGEAGVVVEDVIRKILYAVMSVRCHCYAETAGTGIK